MEAAHGCTNRTCAQYDPMAARALYTLLLYVMDANRCEVLVWTTKVNGAPSGIAEGRPSV